MTPNQANLLDLGQNKGTLHLALRNLDDERDAKARPATLFDLRFRQEKPWDERVKGVLGALAKLQRPAEVVAPPPPPPDPMPPAPDPALLIRTLRGTYQGSSVISSKGPANTSRLDDFFGN